MSRRRFIRTSMLRAHRFRRHDFWGAYCALCHEVAQHPVHHAAGEEVEICGYDACRYCDENNVPGHGVPF